jgi:hypothetical protein
MARSSNDKKSIFPAEEEIQQIIQVYKDGSFKIFVPKT